MTTLNEARQVVYNRFITEWGVTTPFVLDNEQFDAEQINSAWVRLSIKNKIAGQETLGVIKRRRFKRDALLFVQVFTPVNIGLSEGDILCEKVRCIFEGINISDVWFSASTIRENGTDGAWFQMLVETEFSYEQIK